MVAKTTKHNQRTVKLDTIDLNSVAMGLVVNIDHDIPEPLNVTIPSNKRASEESKLLSVLQTAQDTYRDLMDKTSSFQIEIRGQSKLMLEAEKMLLKEGSIKKKSLKLIQNKGKSAIFALNKVLSDYKEIMNKASPRTAEIFESVRIACLIAALPENERPRSLKNAPRGSIIVGKKVTPLDIVYFSDTKGHSKFPGMITETGTSNDHAHILARGMGVVDVILTQKLNLKDGDEIILDGENNQIIIHPNTETKLKYQQKIQAEKEAAQALNEKHQSDDIGILVKTNIGYVRDIHAGNRAFSDGTGLYRTEIGLLAFAEKPGEEVLTEIFSEAANLSKDKPLIIRTIDFTGDKISEFCKDLTNEQQKSLIREQMRAAIKAQRDNPQAYIKIMIPVVETPEQFTEMQKMLDGAYTELDCAKKPDLGAMIETRSIVEKIENLDAAFFSIGTNDLISDILDIDRFNEEDSHKYDETHPEVIAALQKTIKVGKTKNIPVSICGDMASDPRNFVLLRQLGIKKFSVNANRVGVIKELETRYTEKETQAAAMFKKFQAAETREDREQILEDFNRDHMDFEPSWSIMDFAPDLSA